MIIHECQQGSAEWHQLRLGMPTASNFDKVLTAKKLDLSASSFKPGGAYLAELVAELMLDEPLDSASSLYMERGRKYEDEAVAWYGLQQGVQVQRVGFITNDDETAGGSPDALVGDDGGLEVKLLGAPGHVRALIWPDLFATEHRLQVQGYMWLTGRAWWDLLAYNPVSTERSLRWQAQAMPQVLQRIWRDEECIAKLADAVAELVAERDRILERFGYKPLQESRNGTQSQTSAA